jgi:N6-adenosine-specific RNA methylase IME4/transposase
MRKHLPYHPLCTLFPVVTGDEFRKLAADIKTNGLREAIWTYRGSIADGRNRHRACLAAGVTPRFREFKGKDLISFIISMNLRRRHLTSSQRSMLAERLTKLRKGQRADGSTELSQAKAAKLFNVGVATIKRARIVRESGTKQLSKAVERGRLSLFSAEQIARLPKSQQAKLIAKVDASVVIKLAKHHRTRRSEQRHKERIAKLIKLNGKNPKLNTSQRYPIILADVPFEYEFAGARRYSPDSHYPTMSVEELSKMSVDRVAAPDAILFMWVPSPKLLDGLAVMEAWKFRYRTNAVWVKPSPFLGHYFRQAHELLLVGRRGDLPIPLPAARPLSVIQAPRRSGHSSKPDIIYQLIEKMYPRLPKLELFARKRRLGWTSFGNEVADQEAA